MLKNARLVFRAPDMRLIQGWSFSGEQGREVEFYVIEKRREDSLGGECWDVIETFEKPREYRSDEYEPKVNLIERLLGQLTYFKTELENEKARRKVQEAELVTLRDLARVDPARQIVAADDVLQAPQVPQGSGGAEGL